MKPSAGIEGDCASVLDHLLDLVGRYEQEFSLVINESPDQPRTGHAVNVHMRAGYPLHGLFPFFASLSIPAIVRRVLERDALNLQADGVDCAVLLDAG